MLCKHCVRRNWKRAGVWLSLTPGWDAVTEKVALTCWVHNYAAGMALLIIEFTNVYFTAKLKQPNCYLIQERGIFLLFPQLIVERPMERD